MLKHLWFIFSITVVLAVLLPWLISGQISVAVIAGVGLALWIVFTTLQSIVKRTQYFWVIKKLSRSQWGMVVAHLGLAVCALGVVLTSHYSIEKELRMLPQDTVMVGDYQFRFLGVREIKGENYTGVEGGVLVAKNGHSFNLLKPQQRVYTVRQTALADTAIDATLFRDLYVALGEPLTQGAWSLRIYYKPFVRWIWLGGVFMVLGGLLALSDRRYKMILRVRAARPHV